MSFTNQKVCASISAAWRTILGQDTEPQIALNELVPSEYVCVCEWLNVTTVVQCFGWSVDWKRH